MEQRKGFFLRINRTVQNKEDKEMCMKHKIQINIADRKGNKQRIVSGTTVRLPERLLRFLFGDFTEVLVLTPGKTVEGIEVKEIRDGGEHHAETC